jgi:hypothetical protein
MINKFFVCVLLLAVASTAYSAERSAHRKHGNRHCSSWSLGFGFRSGGCGSRDVVIGRGYCRPYRVWIPGHLAAREERVVVCHGRYELVWNGCEWVRLYSPPVCDTRIVSVWVPGHFEYR